MDKHAALLARTIDQENNPLKSAPSRDKAAPPPVPRFSWEIDVWDTNVPSYITRFDTPADSDTNRK